MALTLAGWAASLCLWLPLAVVLPVAGAPGLPLSVRVSAALGLAFAGPRLQLNAEQNVVSLCVRCLVTGGSAALGASVVLFAALMVGGLADRSLSAGSTERGPLETLFGITSALLFLAGGGPSLIGGALVPLGARELAMADVAHMLQDAALAAVTIAVVVAAPLLITMLLFEVVLALATRASWPVAVHGLVPPLRALAFLAALALCFESMVQALGAALR